MSREWNLAFFSILHTGSLGYAYALSGRVAEGVLLLEESLSGSETMGFGVARSLILAFLGEAYVLADRRQGALEFAGRAVSLAHERGQRPYEARALRLLGEVNAWHDNLERADRHYHDALALAEDLGMRPLVAHCYIGLGNLDRRLGKFEEAQKHLTTATAMYREMGDAVLAGEGRGIVTTVDLSSSSQKEATMAGQDNLRIDRVASGEIFGPHRVGSLLGVPDEIRRVVGESLSFEIRGLAARRLAEAAKEAAAAMVEVPVVKMAAAG